MEAFENEQVRTVTDNKSTQSSMFWRMFIPSTTTLLLIAYFILGMLMNGFFKPFTKRGFFCNDDSLNYPHIQDTIGIKMLFLTSLIVPAVVIKLCDKRLNQLLERSPHHVIYRSKHLGKFRKVSDIDSPIKDKDNEEEELMISSRGAIKQRQQPHSESDNEHSEPSDLDIKPGEDVEEEVDLFTRIPLDRNEDSYSRVNPDISRDQLIARAPSEFQLFFFGLSTTILLTGLGKITCGRLRPHFMQRCKPDIDCLDPRYINRYIIDFNCTNSTLTSRGMNYISTSWPSGHASIIFYSMFYLIMYLNSVNPILLHFSSRRAKRRFNPLTVYTIYALMVGLACFIALTRVSDYHHHPLDVCGGAFMGTLIAILWTLSQSKAHLKPFYQNYDLSKQVINLSRGC